MLQSAKLHQLDVYEVIEKADEHVDLKDYDPDEVFLALLNRKQNYAVKHHQHCIQWLAHIMLKRCNADMFPTAQLLMLQALLADLDRLDLLRHVVEIHCNRLLVLKLYAFHSDLVDLVGDFRFISLSLFSVLIAELIDAVPLLGFVELGKDDLLEATGALIRQMNELILCIFLIFKS